MGVIVYLDWFFQHCIHQRLVSAPRFFFKGIPLPCACFGETVKVSSLLLAKGGPWSKLRQWSNVVRTEQRGTIHLSLCSRSWIPRHALAWPFWDPVVQISWDLVVPCVILPIKSFFFFSKTVHWFLSCHRPLEAEVKNPSPKAKRHQTRFLEPNGCFN